MPQINLMTGTAKVVAQLRAKSDGYQRGIERGIKKAALFLQRKSQEVVPVDTGNLKGSAETRVTGKGFDTVATVGYFGVNYAVFVHENMEAHHKEGKYAKFLERPARENAEQIRRIIREEAAKG